MRKAFDANVPKLKPRLGRAAAAPVVEEPAAVAPPVPTPPVPPVPTQSNAPVPPVPTSGPTRSNAPARPPQPPPLNQSSSTALAVGTPSASDETNDVLTRKDRLDKIKRKVAEASRPQPRVHPAPADPARAAESVLGLVRDLEAELLRAREREDALKGDLDEARRELGRTAAEGRSAAEKLAVAERELEEKRGVLAELLGEMQALEEERDASVRRAQALASLDEERAKLLEDIGRRADEEARLRAEREAEVERLSEELRLAGADGARLRAAVGELARERDQLGADLDRTRRERDDLAEAKRALEAVHAALAQARARIG